MESVYYKNLNPKARATYMNILKGLKDFRKEIPLDWGGNTDQLQTDIRESFPEMFYIPIEWRYKMGIMKQELLITYPYSKSQILQIQEKLDEEAKKIISENINDHQGDYDKAVVLHDYLKNNIQYDHNSVSKPLLGSGSGQFLEAHSIVGALLRKSCVCEGFAKAYMYLCGLVGLECYCISGTGNNVYERGPHMWNIVRINGFYHHVDVTWDNQFNDDVNIPNYCYFGLDDKAISRDHNWDKRNYVRCEDDPYNYFKMNNSLITSKVQLERFLKDSFEMEEQHILFKVDINSKLAMEMPGCIDDVMISASSKSRHISVDSWEYQYFQEQLVYSITPSYSYS